MTIAKIKQSDSVFNTVRYCLRSTNARVIGGNVTPQVDRSNLSEAETEAIVQETCKAFRLSLAKNPKLKHPVYHIAISPRPGESLEDYNFSQLGDRFLAGLICSSEDPSILDSAESFQTAVDDFVCNRLSEYQYAQILHADENPHLHQVMTRPNLLTGKAVDTGFDRYRGQSVMRYLEAEFGLERQRCSWELEENQTLSSLRETVQTAAQGNPDLATFISRLNEAGIKVQRKKGEFVYTFQGEQFMDEEIGNGFKPKQSLVPRQSKPSNEMEL